MKVKSVLVVVGVFLLASMVVPVMASPGEVVVATKVAFHILAPYGGLSAQERVDKFYERSNEAGLFYKYDESKLQVRAVKGEVAIFYGSAILLTADLETARLNSMTRQKLAEHWLNKLKELVPDAEAIDVLPK